MNVHWHMTQQEALSLAAALGWYLYQTGLPPQDERLHHKNHNYVKRNLQMWILIWVKKYLPRTQSLFTKETVTVSSSTNELSFLYWQGAKCAQMHVDPIYLDPRYFFVNNVIPIL
jgi:hypothetical protein